MPGPAKLCASIWRIGPILPQAPSLREGQEAHGDDAYAVGYTVKKYAQAAGINRLAAQLWGLTEVELREIQESLKEQG